MALGAGTIRRGDTAALAACLVLSLTALALPAALREPVAGAIRATVLRPLLIVEPRTITSAEYRRSMDALRAERDSLALTAALQPALREENARLRGLLGLAGRIRTGYVPAEVLHQAGVADVLTLVLSAGRAEGVEELAPVITTGGLVGLVHSVDRHTSVALAWTHPDFRASAMVAGGGVFGVVAARRGERATEMMELHGVAYRQQLRPGDLVVTSGLGGVFPRGIPIGTVQGVLSESAEWERTYLLEPAVHPAEAVHVLVLARSHAAESLTAVFRDTLPPAADSAKRAGPARR